MRKCHIYVDGSWLFSQCGGKGLLSRKISRKNENDAFFIEYNKLTNFIKKELSIRAGLPDMEIGERHYFISVIVNIPNKDIPNVDPKYMQSLKGNSKGRLNVIRYADLAGFSVVRFNVDFRPWMPEAIYKTHTYQEKMVDTALVSRLTRSLCNEQYKEDYHVVITGDIDIFPGLEKVIDSALDRIVLFTTDWEQWDPRDAQTSHQLVNMDFAIKPVYLDKNVEEFLSGQYVGRCQKCQLVFTADADTNFCSTCSDTRPIRRSYGTPRHRIEITRGR